MSTIYTYNGNKIIASEDSLLQRDYYCDFSLFQRVGVLGDSYANGNFGESPSATGDVGHPELSWVKQLGRKHGVVTYNYSIGGQSTRSFLTNTGTTGMSALESDPECGLYILVLERNDYNYEVNGHPGYIGTIDDITGHSLGEYPDSFYGNYATIIERVKIHAPKACLVMMVGDYSSSNVLGTAYNNAMKDIANYYEIPYMEQLSDPYFKGDNSYYREKSAGGHPAPYAYSGMELAIERIFGQCVKDNKSYFMYYTGVTLNNNELYVTKSEITALEARLAALEESNHYGFS